MEYADKEQIQRNIDHGRQDQVIKRMPAVSDGLEDADQYVVEDKCQRTGEINPEIEDRVRHDVCGSSHPDKHLGSQDQTDDRQKDACHKGERHVGMDGALKFFNLARAVIAGDHNACAHGDAVKKADHEKDQAAGGADCREGVASEKVSYDQGVGCVVELLEQISQKKRESEHDDLFPDRPFCHQCAGLCFTHFLPPAVVLSIGGTGVCNGAAQTSIAQKKKLRKNFGFFLKSFPDFDLLPKKDVL